MKSSYPPEDVEILLKDISGLVEPLPAHVRERKIQSGTHYCEMLPLEYTPTEQYMAAYRDALENYGARTAGAIAALAEKIYRKKGGAPVIVSLARAGIPVGILLRRYLRGRYGAEIPHYAISIIRGRGIDRNALNYILSRHGAAGIQFVDGWTGKGAILKQLTQALKDEPEIDGELGVVADPANITALCGTHEDILIPSSCLNATVTGLISRTFLRDDIIGPDDFHGAAFYANLRDQDLSLQYLDEIASKFDYSGAGLSAGEDPPSGRTGPEIAREIAAAYHVADLNLIKPGIGETTRVLLRRIPRLIITAPAHAASKELRHVRQLAEEKGVRCELSKIDLGNYKVCGIIQTMSDV